jgi:NAD(P)-dependent dehydrogenase (short-subunit alcohol dehydrogenase family)
MNQRFTDKVVVVTGSASGLGAEAARQFADEGAKLVLVDLNATLLEETAQALKAKGASVEIVPGDVSDRKTAAAAISRAIEVFGRVDVLVNNAAIDPWDAKALPDTSEDLWDQVIAVNLKSAYLFCKHAVPAMLAGGGGSIVNTASIAGITASSQESAYGISKAALIHLTKSIARDYATSNIRSNCVCPGILEAVMSDRRQDMTGEMLVQRSKRAGGVIPMGREGRYEEVARSMLFLASEKEASYITGAALVVDGGYTIV